MATLTLKDVNVNSHFIDNDTTYGGSPIEWIVAAKDVDGTGIVTLVGAVPISEHQYDAAEPDNTSENIRNYGNNDYELSNILQWLNAAGAEGQWYQAQHSTDAPPKYQSEAGFLNGFSEDILKVMQSVSKRNISRKVHLLGLKELGNKTPYDTYGIADVGETYGGYAFDWLSFPRYQYTSDEIRTYYVQIRPNGKDSTGYLYPTFYYSFKNSNVSELNERAYRDSRIATLYAIYVSEDTPVSYINGKYYSKFNQRPSITINGDLGKHKTTFDFSFRVSDEEADIVSVNAYVDSTDKTPFYSSENVTLDTPITISIPVTTYNPLGYGNHSVIIVANDGQKTTTSESTFEKYDIPPSIVAESDLGQKKYAFGFTYKVNDADDTNSAVTISLDGKEIYSDTVALDTDISVNISESDFLGLSYGNHTLTITANDGIKTGTATAAFQKIEISAPVIIAENVGNVLHGFTTYYQVYDEDGGTVNVVIKLDGATIDSGTNVPQQTDLPIVVSDTQINALSYGEHTITIEAVDSDSYTSTKPITFIKKSTPYIAVVNPQIGDVTAPFDITVNYNSADGDAVTVKAIIDGKIEV